jgi:hypothetical protein
MYIQWRSLPFSPSTNNPLLLEGKNTGPVRKAVVVTTRIGVTALVQQLQVARINRKRLIRIRPHKITMADIVRPRRPRVRLSSERVLLRRRIGRPRTVQARSSERPEEATTRTLSLNNHEVLLVSATTFNGVDLHGFEEVVGGVAHDDCAGGAEGPGELANGHACAVDFAVVAREEEIHVCCVSNHGLVDGPGGGAVDLAAEEGLHGAPAVGVGGVGRGAVGEGGGSPLVGQDPDVLGREVEERGGHGGEAAHGVLRGGGHVAPVGEGAEVHAEVLVARVVGGGVDEVLAVVGCDGEVLEVGPSGLGLDERLGGGPLVGRWQGARLGRDCGDHGQSGRDVSYEAHDGGLGRKQREV